MATKNSKRNNEILDASARQRGLDRAAHFAAGGTTAMWRGTRSVTKNGKAVASKKACRNSANW